MGEIFRNPATEAALVVTGCLILLPCQKGNLNQYGWKLETAQVNYQCNPVCLDVLRQYFFFTVVLYDIKSPFLGPILLPM